MVSKKKIKEEEVIEVPARFKYDLFDIHKSEWWNLDSQIPDWVNEQDNIDLWSYRTTVAQRLMEEAKKDWLRSLKTRPKGVSIASWNIAHTGNSTGTELVF